MRIKRCDRCAKEVKSSDDPHVMLMSFSSAIGSIDLCVVCTPPFVRLANKYLKKTEKAKRKK